MAVPDGAGRHPRADPAGVGPCKPLRRFPRHGPAPRPGAEESCMTPAAWALSFVRMRSTAEQPAFTTEGPSTLYGRCLLSKAASAALCPTKDLRCRPRPTGVL